MNFIYYRDNTSNVVLMLTHKCQLDCLYCKLERNYPDMPESIMTKAIDLLFTSPSDNLELQFFGGEPLLRFDLIKKGIAYAEKKEKESHKKVTFILTTNGLALNKDKLEFLGKHRTKILFSIDGELKYNKKNRPFKKGVFGTQKILIHNLRYLQKSGIEYFINLTFLPEDVIHIYENVKYCINLGIKNIQIAYAIGAYWSERDLFSTIEQFKKIKNIISRKNKQGDNIRIYNFELNFEPVLASPQIFIDSLGNILIGCLIILEKELPHMHKAFYFGNIKAIKDISLLQRSKSEQMALVMKQIDDKKIFSNILFGVGLYIFFKLHENKAVNYLRGNYLFNDKIMLMLTYKCQLDCRYCGLERNYPDMPESIMTKAIDLLFTSPSDNLELQFFGGEPLLRFDLIKKGIVYAEKKEKQSHKKVMFILATNGIALDKDKLEFLSKHRTRILFSIDGMKPTHIKNRPLVAKNNKKYPYKNIIDNIKFLAESGQKFFVNMVVGPNNISTMYNNLFYFIRCGARSIHISYELGTVWDKRSIIKYFLNFTKIINKAVHAGKAEIIMNIMNMGIDDEPYLISPALTVDYDGTIYSGCTIPLEKKFPEMRKTNQVGTIFKIKRMTAIRRNIQEAFESVVALYPNNHAKKTMLVSSLFIGIMSGWFCGELFGKEFIKNKNYTGKKKK